ncbi:MAG: tetratricopeptide repeat protein [Myxococcota bacterium]
MSQSFGRYELLSRIATGGMGEVFLARATGAAGFEKLFVVKRVLPHLSSNAEFRDLFLDEARIAARLNHPGIAQIFELGDVDGQWFIAMEYVPGKDLRRIGGAARAQQRWYPVGLACRIIADAAAALDYAHKARDAQGRAMRIVHRDVSPHNLLVSFDGVVKLIDFGVARATNRLQETGQGILRGKYPYMSPEQITDDVANHLSDQFSLGVVFWELLTGKRLFRSESDAMTLQLVAECNVPPPRQVQPGVPAGLDAIAVRMLAKDPAARFTDLAEARMALEDFVLDQGLPAGAAHLAAFMRELFPEGDTLVEEPLGDPQRTKSSRSVARGSASGSQSSAKAAALLEQVVGERPAIPQAGTSFVGRARELSALRMLLSRGERVVTLLGPGGAGKTRLAMEVARHFDGPAFFADLTGAVDFEGVCLGVARALGVGLLPGVPPEQAVGRALAARGPCLVVVDNFEQVVREAEPTVAAWRAAAPESTFVVTSREPLRVPEEVLYEVPPLDEAVDLFLERARAARPGWEPSPADLRAVQDIVAMLDGLPLAIELAAARLAMLSPAQLMQRLPRRLDLLKAPDARVAARQATMRGAIDWSWELLQPHEQAALAQLGVFRGGFSLEAVEAVVDVSAYPTAPWALDVVQTLKEKSLVRAWEAGEGGELRFGLLESIREYALEKLRAQPGGGEDALARHAVFFLELGRRLAAAAETKEALRALEQLQLERDNLSSVFQRAVGKPKSADAAREALEAALALDPLLSLRGPFGAHVAMLEAATRLGAETGVEGGLRAKGLVALGIARQARGQLVESLGELELALTLTSEPRLCGRAHHYAAASLRQQGRMDEAKPRYEQALALVRKAGDRWMEGRVLGHLGGLSQEMGAVDASRQFYERALAIHREVGDRRFEGIALANLGSYHHEKKNQAQARKLFEDALRVHREVGNRRSEGMVLSNLASLARSDDRPDEAQALLDKALSIHRETGNARFEAIARYQLGMMALEKGDALAAEQRFGQALATFRVVNDRRYIAVALGHRAAALVALGRPDEAKELLTEADEQLAQVTDAHFHAVLALCRAHLDVAAKPERARARIAEVQSPQGGLPSLAEQSEHVRSAVRCLQRALE